MYRVSFRKCTAGLLAAYVCFFTSSAVVAINCKTWMGDHLNTVISSGTTLGNTPLMHLTIPGSHDSGTYTMGASSRVSSDGNITGSLSDVLTSVVKCAPSGAVMSRWSKTQSLTAAQQLEAGVRYFDLRISREQKNAAKRVLSKITKKSNTELRLVHGLIGVQFKKFLQEVSDFLNAHPNEKIILDIQHIYNFNSRDEVQEIFSMLEEYLGGKMAKAYEYGGSLSNLTVNSMNAHGHSVLVLCRDQDGDANGSFRVYGRQLPSYATWSLNSLQSPWPNSSDISTVESRLKSNIASRNMNALYVSQYILSADGSYIASNLTSSIKKFTESSTHVNYANFLPQLKAAATAGGKCTNIIMMDFINAKIAKTIIGLNF